MDISQADRNALYLSSSVIALTIVAIAVFVVSGGSYLFYLIAIITIILGFYMSYYISKERVEKPKKKKSK
ncbi:MAG: hypothetical protein ACP5P2_01230 [Candidatus Micrarchaeia archaeon]|jgi:4-hydroxybenzoate polyprenyltransferase